ncbi:hypothetical protein Dfer_0735 [Dyadobacter fermentans DSM 18053]|uniref:Uncharacterized protein n=2 Tax=Dyadobacter fermentans TaxID=94254 RepID=C6W1D9_DYAFD|nr:hypothetical protein Dfer_0735 [Dyadobacter fermentans DSM 18053]
MISLLNGFAHRLTCRNAFFMFCRAVSCHVGVGWRRTSKFEICYRNVLLICFRNLIQFNQLICNIMRNLLLSTLLLLLLHFGQYLQAQSASQGSLADTENVPSYVANVTVNSEGKIRLVVDNPENLRCKITIFDDRDKVIYQEFSSQNKYRKLIDISPVPGDSAKVILTIDGKRFVYHIKKTEWRRTYTVEPVIALR